MLWLGLSYLLSIVAQLAVNGLAGRVLGPAGLSAFVAVASVCALSSQLGLLGTQTLALRDAAGMRDGGDPALLSEHAHHVRTLCLLVLPSFGLVTGLLVALVASPGPTRAPAMGLAVFVLVVLGGLQKLYANYLRGFGDVRISGFLEGRSGGPLFLMLQAVLLSLLFALASTADLTTVLVVLSLASLPGVLLGRARLRAYVPRPVGLWRPWRQARGMLARTRGFALVHAGTFLDLNLEVFLVVAVLPAYESSTFVAAQRLAMVVVLPLALLQLVVSPAIVRLQESREGLQSLVRTVATLGTISAALIAVPIALFGARASETLYGTRYEGIAFPIAALAIGYGLRVVIGMAPICLTMMGEEGLVARCYWLGVFLRLVLGIGAAALFGLEGVVVVAVGGAVLTVLAMTWLARRRFDLRTTPTFRPDLRLLAVARG